MKKNYQLNKASYFIDQDLRINEFVSNFELYPFIY